MPCLGTNRLLVLAGVLLYACGGRVAYDEAATSISGGASGDVCQSTDCSTVVVPTSSKGSSLSSGAVGNSTGGASSFSGGYSSVTSAGAFSSGGTRATAGTGGSQTASGGTGGATVSRVASGAVSATGGVASSAGGGKATATGGILASGGALGEGGTASATGGLAATGGTSSGGTAGATTGTTAPAWRLPDSGAYEIWFDADAPVDDGCEPVLAGARLNMSIQTEGCERGADALCTAAFEVDGLWGSIVSADRVQVADGTFGIALNVSSYKFSCEERVTRIELGLGPNGFTGTGSAVIERTCADQEPRGSGLALVVAPRHTGPRFRFVPLDAFAPYAVSWGPVRFWSDTAITYTPPQDEPDLDHLFTLQSTDEPPKSTPVRPAVSMWPAVLLSEPDAFDGSNQRPLLKSGVADALGNPATIDTTPIQFVKDEVVTDVLDLDNRTTPMGMVGETSYVPSGAPCEAGGCIVIGPGRVCPTHLQPTFFSWRMPLDYPVKLRIRLAIESSKPQLRTWPVLIDSLAYILMQLAAPLMLLEEPHGGLTYSTGFFNLTAVSQSSDPRGMAIGFICSYGYDDAIARVILERIEVERDTSRN